MANFTTHIAVGTLASGMLATLTMAADVIAPENVVGVTLAGVLGSVLPDIDLKMSRPSQAIFNGLAVFLSFAILFNFAYQYSIAEMWIIWLAVYLGVRYGAHFVFHRMSYHRGIYHSVIAGLFFAFVTAIIYHYLLGRHEGVAWLAGGFLFIGYLIHLTLDEIYSVDIMDTRIKASYGTALKLWDHKHMGHSTAMAVAMVIAFLLTPPAGTFVDGITSRPLWAGLRERLLPKDKWFGVIAEAGGPSVVFPANVGARITTGSVGSRSAGADKAAAPAAKPQDVPERAASPAK